MVPRAAWNLRQGTQESIIRLAWNQHQALEEKFPILNFDLTYQKKIYKSIIKCLQARTLGPLIVSPNYIIDGKRIKILYGSKILITIKSL